MLPTDAPSPNKKSRRVWLRNARERTDESGFLVLMDIYELRCIKNRQTDVGQGASLRVDLMWL